MNAIISNGDYTARVQLPVERRQLAGALSYLNANHASAYDIKYNEDSDKALSYTLECHGIVENAIAKALPTGFRFHTLNDTIALMHNLPYLSKREFEKTVKVEGLASYEQLNRMLTEAYPQSVTTKYYHPDHIGLVSELMSQNIKLLLIDTQVPYIHFADKIFERDKRLNFKSIDIENATVIRLEESRAFLKGIGINGEIVSTPSHSQDSVSLILDSGECFVGDLEPMEYLDGYQLNESLQNDWERIKSYSPRVINYAHANQKIIK